MRADRLVSLALLLQARGRMSAQQLAGELEVSVRTVYRDISALNAAGVPVLAEPGPNGGCRLIEGYRFPLRGLSADEAEALLLLGVPAAVAELGLADALAAAQRKVSTRAGLAAAAAGDGRPSALVHLDLPRWFHGTEPVPHLRTLAEAVRLGSRLLIEVRVRAAPAALAVFPYAFGDAGRNAADAAGPADADGHCEVTLTFEDERVAAHRLAGFGGGLEVLSPGEVRGLLLATGRELLGRYGRPSPEGAPGERSGLAR